MANLMSRASAAADPREQKTGLFSQLLSGATFAIGATVAIVGLVALMSWGLNRSSRHVHDRRQLGQPIHDLGDAGFDCIAFSPDGRTVASGDTQGIVRLWDVGTHRQLGRPLDNGPAGWGVSALAFSPDGRLRASTNGNVVRMWDVRHRKLIRPLTANTDVFLEIAFSPDGRMLAAGTRSDLILFWDVRTGKLLRPIIRAGNGAYFLYAIAFSPDARTLVSAGPKGIRFWDVRTHRAIGRPLARIGSINTVSFSPDGRTLASGDLNGTVRLWDVRTRTERSPALRGHSKGIESLAFSPDGRTLASGSDDRTIRLWDVRTHRELGAPLRGDTDLIYDVAFSPKGRLLASASWDETIRFWAVHSAKP